MKEISHVTYTDLLCVAVAGCCCCCCFFVFSNMQCRTIVNARTFFISSILFEYQIETKKETKHKNPGKLADRPRTEKKYEFITKQNVNSNNNDRINQNIHTDIGQCEYTNARYEKKNIVND